MKYILLCLYFFPFAGVANELNNLYQLLDDTLKNPSLTEEAMLHGKDRAMVCKYCHGKVGNSRRAYIPNLASQSPRYLLRQFELFASKQRKDRIMSELAENLTARDRVNIALYYSRQQARPHPAFKADLVTEGRGIYGDRCASCHGKKAYGGQLLPRLASQPAEYLRNTLIRYRSHSTWRPRSPMQDIAAALDDDELDAVVAYVSAMK